MCSCPMSQVLFLPGRKCAESFYSFIFCKGAAKCLSSIAFLFDRAIIGSVWKDIITRQYNKGIDLVFVKSVEHMSCLGEGKRKRGSMYTLHGSSLLWEGRRR